MEEIKVLEKDEEILAAYKKFGVAVPSNFVAFYHGGLNAIITDTKLMMIHFFDRQVHRGYSVFDTCNMFNRKLYLFEQHMARFFTSIKLANMKRPKSASEIIGIMSKVAELTGEKTLNFRYWCSRGSNDLDITTKESEPTVFYLVAMKGRPVAISKGMMNAFTVSTEVKGPLLSKIKSTNYLLNCLAADEAAKKGGLGIMITEDGYVTEGSVQAVAFVLRDNSFYSPPYFRALRSITEDRVLELVEKHLVSSGKIKKISHDRMTLEELKKEVTEMMLLGGERLVPIKHWDGQLISPTTGPITEKLIELLEADYSNPESYVPIISTKL